MRIATLEDHRRAVELVQQEFDREWLEASSSHGNHPVPKRWKELSEALARHERGFSFGIAEPILLCTRFAEDLRLAIALAGYTDAIRPRLKKVDEFSKVEYEISVAAACVRSGFTPEFIVPTGDKRTADLLLRWAGTNIHAECTRRDPYIPAEAAEEPMTTLLDSVRSRSLAGLEVTVVVLSALDAKDVPKILSDVEQIEQDSTSGGRRRAGYGVYVQNLPAGTCQ
jgi:hypothetical protein